VERQTFMHDGKVCVLDTGYRGLGIIPVGERRYGWSLFYVHPESGLLCAALQKSWKALRAERRATRAENFRWLDDHLALKQIGGIWFACQFRVVSDEGPFKAYDHALGQHVGRGGLLRREDQYLHCIIKRQLSRRELRRYGLRNVSQLKAQSSVSHASGLLTTALRLSAGRRLWVLVNPVMPVQIRSVACDGGATLSTPGNSTVAFLPADFVDCSPVGLISHVTLFHRSHFCGVRSISSQVIGQNLPFGNCQVRA
jgi:hypothetical protein